MERLSIISTFPVGVPSWTLPERQHDDIPTPVDMMIEFRIYEYASRGEERETGKSGCDIVKRVV